MIRWQPGADVLDLFTKERSLAHSAALENSGFVRHDERREASFVLENRDFAYEGRSGKDGLKLLGKYLFAIGEHDELFATAHEVEVSRSVDPADISRTKPAVRGERGFVAASLPRYPRKTLAPRATISPCPIPRGVPDPRDRSAGWRLQHPEERALRSRVGNSNGR